MRERGVGGGRRWGEDADDGEFGLGGAVGGVVDAGVGAVRVWRGDAASPCGETALKLVGHCLFLRVRWG